MSWARGWQWAAATGAQPLQSAPAEPARSLPRPCWPGPKVALGLLAPQWGHPQQHCKKPESSTLKAIAPGSQ